MFDNPDNVFFVDSLDTPIHEGCRREVATYDNGFPVYWVDIPEGTRSWTPVHLCTEAARIYMMSDAEYDTYAREERSKELATIKSKMAEKCFPWCVALGVLLFITVVGAFFLNLIFGLVVLFLFVLYVVGMAHLHNMYIRPRLAARTEIAIEGDRIIEELEGFSGSDVLFSYSAECVSQIRRLMGEIESVGAILDGLFAVGSATWHRYHDTVVVAFNRVVVNAETLLKLVEYANGTHNRAEYNSCMDKASSVLRDNNRVCKSVSALHTNLDSFAFNERLLDASSDADDIVTEVDSLSENLSLYRSDA